MKFLLAQAVGLLLCLSAVLNGATVYLPAPGAMTTYSITGATTATPIVITVKESAPPNGTPLWIYGVGGQSCANGFWITTGASGSTFQLTYMYYGGNANGSQPNCSGAYSGGGTAVLLSAYTVTAHPRVYFDGPAGTLTTALKDTGPGGRSNPSNPPFAALTNSVNNWNAGGTAYQNTGADQTDPPWCCYMGHYAAASLLYLGTGNATDLAIAKWGVQNANQLMPGNNFYCAGDQCNNNNQNNYITPDAVWLAQAFSIVRSQLTMAQIQTFADMMLNDSAYLNNGVGVRQNSANPLTSSCTNANWTTWVSSSNYCGMLFYSRYLTYSPQIAPGQEAHYAADYIALNPTASQPGVYNNWPHGDNLTLSKLYGYIGVGLALADDDARAQMLVTQAYTYWYEWYWPFATSGWTARNQGSRYTSFNVGPLTWAIAAIMKTSTGLDITAGQWLSNLMPLTMYQALPGWPSSYNYMDQWGDVYVPDNNQIDWAGVLSGPLYMYRSSPYAAYANYFMLNTMNYTTGQWGGESFAAAYLPYIFIDPTWPQTNPNGSAATQFLYRDTDLAICQATFGSTPASGNTSASVPPGTFGCFPNSSYGGAISKSDWTATATQVNVQAMQNINNYDHSGCGQFGSYHIYRKDYLLAGDSSGANNGPNGAAHTGCNGGGGPSTDMLIAIGAGDNWNTSSGSNQVAGGPGWAYVNIPRWGSVNPSGDAAGRYAYMLIDMTPSYTPAAKAARVNRSLIHFKKSGTQDYLLDYDDVALTSGNQVQAWFDYWNHPATGSQSITPTGGASGTVVSRNTTAGNFLASSFLPVAGANTITLVPSGTTGLTNRQYVCPSTNGTSCNTSATSLEAVIVHKPSTNPNDSMPAISQPSCTGTGGNCTVVDIQDAAYPKVAVFARQGALLTAASFTSVHAGSAQYLIAGLAAGSYTVTQNGSPLAGSPFSVASGDHSLYFEGASGVYSITQSGGSGGQAPAIANFSANPGAIAAGQSSTLSWSVSGTPAPALSISPGVGTVTGSSVTVSPSSTVTYTLTATNSAGTATASTTVTVSQVSQPPVINSFASAPQSIIAGQTATLSWSVSGSPAPTLSIDNGIGAVTGTSISVSPLATTTYKLTAANSAGTVSSTAAIMVGADSTPPSVPANLSAVSGSSSQVALSWNASTDNVAVAGYSVFRNGTQIGTTATPGYTDSGLSPATSYSYTVSAFDAVRNFSAQSAPAAVTTAASSASLGGCTMFPADNIWNTPVNNLPVDPNSSAYINTIGSSTPLHPDFSSTGGGVPYNIVPASQPLVTVNFTSNSQGDPGPYPIPSNAQVEQGSDHHVLVLDQGSCKLYELWQASLNADRVTWSANDGAVFDLNSDILRPNGWTSADAAGLPILPGLIRYDEVMSGQINHAIRVTAPQTLNQYIWPARHYASNLSGSQYPPLGERFRLKAGYNVSGFSPQVQTILNALKTYGAILADNGSSWYLTGAPDPRWNDSDLHNLSQVLGSNLEAVNTSSLMVEANSGAVTGTPLALAGIYLNQRQVAAGAGVSAEAILTAAAPAGGAAVAISNASPQAITAPASVTIPAGAISAPISVTVNSIPLATPAALSGTWRGATVTSPVLLVNGTSGSSAPLLSTIAVSVNTIVGGNPVTGTVTLFGAAPSGGTAVALSSSNTSVATVPASVTVPAGATTATFPVATLSQAGNAGVTVTAALNGESLGVPITVIAGPAPPTNFSATAH